MDMTRKSRDCLNLIVLYNEIMKSDFLWQTGHILMQEMSACASLLRFLLFVCSTLNSRTTHLTDIKFGGCHPNGTDVCIAKFVWLSRASLSLYGDGEFDYH